MYVTFAQFVKTKVNPYLGCGYFKKGIDL